MRLAQLAEPGDERLGAALSTDDALTVLERMGGDGSLLGVEHYRSRLSLDPDQPVRRLSRGRWALPDSRGW